MLKTKSIMATLCAIVVTAGSLYSQTTWIRQYGMIGSDRVYSLDLAKDGSYICAGRSTSFSDWSYEDAYLLRVDFSGDTLWTKHPGGEYDERFYSVRTCQDTGYICAGYTEGTDTLNLNGYVVKFNQDGEVEWERSYGGASSDTFFSVCELSTGGFAAAGNTASYGAGGTDIWLLRFEPDGDTLWTRTFGGPTEDLGYAICETADKGLLIAGSRVPLDTNENQLYLLKVDSAGAVLWEKEYGGEWDEFGYCIWPNADGSFAITGTTWSQGSGKADVWLLKIGASGDTLWTRTYGGTDKDEGYSVAGCTDGGYIISGYTMSYGAGYEDFYVIRTDALGDTLWTRTFGGEGADLAYGARQAVDAGFMIAGRTRSFGLARCDVYLVKTDADGNVAGISENPIPETPLSFELNQATIRFALPYATNVSLKVYDISGRLVTKLQEGKVEAGVHSVRWNGN
ncbi:hypothetical protein GX441_06820, partial [bacterium]|nr:hypothetical protein [bacterium]